MIDKQLQTLIQELHQDIVDTQSLFHQRLDIISEQNLIAKQKRDKNLQLDIEPIRVFCSLFVKACTGFLTHLDDISNEFSIKITPTKSLKKTGHLVVVNLNDLTTAEKEKERKGFLNPKQSEINKQLNQQKNFWETHNTFVEDILLIDSYYNYLRNSLLQRQTNSDQQNSDCITKLLNLIGQIKLNLEIGKECLGTSESRYISRRKALTEPENRRIRIKYLGIEPKPTTGNRVRPLDPNRLGTKSKTKIQRHQLSEYLPKKDLN